MEKDNFTKEKFVLCGLIAGLIILIFSFFVSFYLENRPAGPQNVIEEIPQNTELQSNWPENVYVPNGAELYLMSCKICSEQFGRNLAKQRNQDIGKDIFTSSDFGCFAAPRALWDSNDFEKACKEFQWETSGGVIFVGVLDKEMLLRGPGVLDKEMLLRGSRELGWVKG